MLLGKGHCFFKWNLFIEVDTGLLFDGIGHGDPSEWLRDVDGVSVPLIGVFADDFLTDVMEEAFGPLSHIAEVAISLIELDGGEFWVMSVVDAFVTEDTSDFVNAVDAANHALLEVELSGDAEEEILIESVVMGDEWTGGCATGDWGKDRSLDFDEAKGVAVVSDSFDDSGSG